MGSKFTHLNPGFTCEHCGTDVPPLMTGCRNHCPNCLYCKHVDYFPGDRANPCQGLMKPTNYQLNSKKGIVLTFKCLKCGDKIKNKSAYEDERYPDSYDKILSLNPASI